MNKADLRVLERAFAMEVRGSILQGKSKRIDALVASGHLQPETITFGGRFSVTCKGYSLTHLGRLEYCMTCDEPSVDEEDKMRGE